MEDNAKIAITIIYGVLFAAAMLGNVLVIFLVLQRSGMKSPTNLLLVNMALADILFAVFMFPLALIRYHVRAQWIGGAFGEFSCRTMFFMSHLPIAGSTTTLIFIAFERFFAIMYPYKEVKFFHKVWIITLIIWLSSAFLMFPVGVSAVTAERNGQIHCNRDWSVFGDPQNVSRTFYDVTFVAMYAIPLVAMAVIYTVICRKLWKHHVPGRMTEHARQNSMLHKRQVVRMLITVVIVFALCWLPTHAQHFIMTYSPEVHARFPFVLKISMNLIGHCNPAINPCLLVGLNIRFRREFFKLFSRGRTVPLTASPRSTRAALHLEGNPESSTEVSPPREGGWVPVQSVEHVTSL